MAEQRVRIGVQDCYIAKVLTDTSSGMTHDTPVRIPGTVKVDIKPNGGLVVDYGDDQALVTVNYRGVTDGTVEFLDVPSSIVAELLGQTRANGITGESALDQSPYYALGFRVWISGDDGSGGKVYQYFWYHKGKFSVPDGTYETKKDTVTPQHVVMNAQFISNTYNGLIGVNGRTDESLPTATEAAWFNAPVLAPTVDLGALGVVIAKSSTDTTFTFTKTGGGTFSINTDSAVVGSTILVSKAGANQAGAIVWTGQGTATVVGTFTPTTAYGTADIDFAVTSGVKDSNNVGCTPELLQIAYP
jgi:phi13 family phage major tail protein